LTVAEPKETVLCVDETQTAGHVNSIGAVDRRDPEGIAFDGDRGREPGDPDLTLEIGEAPGDQTSNPQTGPDKREKQHNNHDSENLEPPTHPSLLWSTTTLANDRH
jgi:hypothetical protein